MKLILRKILSWLALALLRKYNPRVVAITGSAGKTSTKEAASAVLSKYFHTRKTERNLNTEYGVPLTIIGITIPVDVVSPAMALFGVFHALRQLVIRNRNYPEVLVLELGADRPGDIRHFMRWLKPSVGVITAIGSIPAHVEFYSGPEAVAAEKSWVARKISKNGAIILNRDDTAAWGMQNLIKARTFGFGFSQEADVRVTDYRVDFPNGIAFKLFASGSFVPVRLPGCLGKPHAYAAAAAAAVGLAMDLNLIKIADALLSYQAPPGRSRLLKGIKETWIIDDTYNASPAAMRAALVTLGELPVNRKIAVLGAMREIGKFTYEAHEEAGFLAAETASIIITVGDTAKIISAAAKSKGFPTKSLMHFDTVREAGQALQRILVTGDAVLIKGSRLMHMEKVVEEIMAEPGRAAELLVH